MFDTSAEIELRIRLVSAGNQEQGVGVRWPTDEEWAAYNRAHKSLVRHPGRGVTETIPPEPNESDVKLYKAIALNGAPEATAAEAFRMFKAMSMCEVLGVTIDGVDATVSMSILTGEVTHTLKVPTADQVSNMRRGYYRVLGLPYNMQEVRTNIDSASRLYDECGGKSADYQGAVPAMHKDLAINAVIDYIERALGPKPNEANF